jgi:tetratricopeptide (TPR) repeat protein
LAFENAKSWVELYPEAKDGHHRLAGQYDGMEQHDAAIAEHQRILEFAPESHDELLHIGDLYKSIGEFEEALKYYEQYAKIYPNELGTLRTIGDLYHKNGQFEQAKPYYKKALLIEPERIGLIIDLARTEMHLGNSAQALQQCQNALKIAKTAQDRSLAYVALWKYHQFMGQMRQAIEYGNLYLAEIEKFESPLRKSLLRSTVEFMEVYALAGKEDVALKIIKEFEAQAHQSVPPYNQLPFLPRLYLNLFLEDPKTVAALEEDVGKLEAFIEQTKLFEEQRLFIYAARAKINEYRNEFSQAIMSYQQAAAMELPREYKVLVMNRIGQCYSKSKEFEKAKETFQKALNLEPYSPLAHYELALVYWEQDKKEQALEHLKITLKVWGEADAEYKPAKLARAKLAEWEAGTAKM